MRVIESKVMPGGWHFMQDSVKIEGTDYRDLIQKVLEWRLANNKVVGNVQADIDKYICTSWPEQCQMTTPGGRPIPRPVQQPSGHTDTLTQWALRVQKMPGVGDIVLEQIANERTAICAECPKNKPIKHGCGTCHANLERLLTILRRGKDVSHWRKLNFCEPTGQDCRTIVWLKKDYLQKSGDLWDKCWLK